MLNTAWNVMEVKLAIPMTNWTFKRKLIFRKSINFLPVRKWPDIIPMNLYSHSIALHGWKYSFSVNFLLN